MYEQASERWSPVQSVEKVILSVISMLAGMCLVSFEDVIPIPLNGTEPNLESGANIDCCKLYRDNQAVSFYGVLYIILAQCIKGIRETCERVD